MSTHDFDLDKYEEYEEEFNPLRFDRQARRKRKPKQNHNPKKSTYEIVEEIADTTGIEGEFTTSYTPARHEKAWLYESVRSFYERELISDILAQVKGGKEASVYRCAGLPASGKSLLAAKVYRPRMFRNLRNDKMYRQGRQTLTPGGDPVDPRDSRTQRAIDKKSAYGVQVEHTSWLMYEFTTLRRLFEAGASVPEPIYAGSNAILMDYIGDEDLAAPTLNEIRLDPEEAEPLFQEVMRNIELMLQMDLIHGDLSAYNILYWEGRVIFIDFPQVTNSRTNENAHFILERDVTRICQYFSQQGVECDVDAIMDKLWEDYIAMNAADWDADESLKMGDAWFETEQHLNVQSD